MKVKSDHRSKFSNLSNWKEEAWKKNQGFNGIQTRDLRDTGAMLLKLSLNWKIYCDDHSSLCQSENVVYSIICRRCGCLYIGETERRLRERFSDHLRSVRNNSPGFPVAEHFKSASHSLNDIMICGLKRCSGDKSRRKNQEMRLIFELGTLKPNGLNINFSFI